MIFLNEHLFLLANNFIDVIKYKIIIYVRTYYAKQKTVLSVVLQINVFVVQIEI